MITTNAAQFRIELEDEARQLTVDEVNDFIASISSRALTLVVFRTPVDTGRARANWNTSLNQVNSQVNENAFDTSGSTAIATGLSVIARINATTSKVIIANNVSYIDFLEGGSSAQAPNGMVALTVNELQNVRAVA